MKYSTLLSDFHAFVNENKQYLRIAGRITVLAFLAVLYFPVFATVYNVTNTTDGNAINQLRGALVAANGSAGPHTVNVAAGTYNLTMGKITFGSIAQNITITGAGSAVTIINMTSTSQDRIFLINPPGTIAGVQTTITGIAFTNGHLTSDNFGGGAIVAGGPANALTLTGCIFQNNTVDASKTTTAAGAIRFTGGGALTIDQCTFSNNTSPATTSGSSASGVGGAISFEAYSYSISGVYTYPDNSLSVTNSIFSNNTAASYPGLSGQGGAINVSAGGFSTIDPPRPTLSIIIRENTFISNSVTGSEGRGGAISATNSFSTTNTFLINYNRFYGNTAGIGLGTALISFDTQGNVDATNNWWGCNNGSASCADKAFRFAGSSGGVLTTTPYLQLRTSASTPVCSGAGTTITSGFTVNSSSTAIPVSNLGAFAGVPISFSATGGTLSSQQTTIQSTGTATATYTPAAAGAGTVNAVVDNVPSNDLTARASVTINAGPAVTDQPDNTSACIGSSASFIVAASGSGTLSYQWYKGGALINGATSATYTIGSVTAGDAATNYNVRVSSTTGCGPAQSVNATLTVNTVPTITDQPDNTTACIGSPASFIVAASGSGTLSYQWYKGGALINGATSATYTISSVTAGDAAANYNVRVSSTTGCTIAQSANASLTVNTLPSVTNPANAITCVGTSVSFTVTASGSGTLSYQWYKGATALSNGTSSNISGVTTATLTIGNPGIADAANNYNVRVSSTTGCTTAQSGNATLTVNTLPAISTQPAVSSTACTGDAVSFTAAASGSGTLSYQWYKGAALLANGTTASGSIISGATTTTLTISNLSPSDNAPAYNVQVSSTTGCTTAQSNNAALIVSLPVTATATTNSTDAISSTNTVVTNASCSLIATVTPSGTAPVGGNVSTTVTITGTVQTAPNGSPYAQRHYDIVPSVNAATATANLTLYFTQAEFTAYNAAANHGANLPVDAADAANNKANIRIFQYHGIGTAPGNYTGTAVEINPADANIIYNSTYSRWEITFTVTGFSGFYLASAGSIILPLKLISFTGFTDGTNAQLQWKTSDEVNVSYFEIERSIDAVRFTKVGQLSAGSNSYSFTDKPDVKTVYYYRLKMVDKDGKISYSYTVAINLKKALFAVQALPNPFTDKLMLNITSLQQSKAEIRLTDVSGKTLLKKTVVLQTGTNSITLNEVGAISKGTYFIQVVNEKMNELIKVIKAD